MLKRFFWLCIAIGVLCYSPLWAYVDNPWNEYLFAFSDQTQPSVLISSGPVIQPAGSLQIQPKNHYKSWLVPPQTVNLRVRVEDQFMIDSLHLATIECFANPVKKTVGDVFFDILKPDNHLTWYRAHPLMASYPPRNVTYKNQIESTTVVVDSVQFLLVPTQKRSPFPHPPPESLDHYKGYRILNPKKIPVDLLLEDQFDSRIFGVAEHIDTLMQAYFFTPARKNQEKVYDTVTHYVAYAIFPPRPVPPPGITVNDSDQFGLHELQVVESQFLLVPTEKFIPPPPDTGKNHYKTWRLFTPLPIDTFALVRDQFTVYDPLTLTAIDLLSNPAVKDTSSIKRPDDHLSWYRAQGKALSAKVDYVNQFESTTVYIDSVKYLLLPTQKLQPFHDPPDTLLGHYTAYKIRNPKIFPRVVQIQDQFDLIPESIDSLVPKYFLTPAQKNNEPVFGPDTHYVAYQIFPQRVAHRATATSDQFGSHSMEVHNSELLLVPTEKKNFLICTHKPNDCNGDGKIDLVDIVCDVNVVFKNAPKPVPICRTDCNGSGGNPNLVDIVCKVNYVFKGGPAPVVIGECCIPVK